jgi:flagellar biosynthesis protein FlhA
LDLLLALSLATAVMIMLVSLYSKKPLDFSTFPSVLLLSTLFRLALNVASTRNILIHGPTDGTGAAGELIKSFGEFVVEGNFVVGIIVLSF